MLESREPSAEVESRGFWRSALRRYRRHRRGMVGLALLIALLAVAFFAPILASEQPILCRYKGRLYAPGLVQVLHRIPGSPWLVSMPKPFRFPSFSPRREIRPEEGDWALWPPVRFGPNEVDLDLRLRGRSPGHWLGTDEVGRDVLARMIHGAAVSMQVGFISMGIAALIGLAVGALAGYAGGRTDQIISRFIEIVMCFPTFFLILAILVWLKPSIYNVMIVIGITSWTSIARYTRGEFLRLRTLDYALAARALGAGPARIIVRHILPNSLAPVLVVVTFGIASAILTESALSWLGFGVMPPQPSWGNILRSAYDNLRTGGHMIYPPCIAIFFGVLCFNLVSDALRDVTDPRLHEG
ncbi:MAG: ABC transporter permease [Planctomycetales bacterium]|nr:ABC transporter permease [Planctomycetales bacterium]